MPELEVITPELEVETKLEDEAVRMLRFRAKCEIEFRKRVILEAPEITPHEKQKLFIESVAKRKVIRAGRRGGKTTGIGELAVRGFKAGRRILYATPTAEQIGRFWKIVTEAFATAIEAGVLVKNETMHTIELPGTEQRIRAKTAWNADTMRGDYADLLIFDEWQLMDETAWTEVGVPMLLDNNGDAVFVYTPPSLHSRSASKAQDVRHAAKLYKKAAEDKSGRWAAFHFTSHDNPHLSLEALSEIEQDMTSLAMRQEILAEDIEDAPGALWKRADIKRATSVPEFERIVVGLDPSATSDGDEAGIIVAGKAGKDYYVLSDMSRQGSPQSWGTAAVAAYRLHKANVIVPEVNNGGEMVSLVLHQVDETVSVKPVTASRGKATRAEPVAALYEQGHVYHVGEFTNLEDEMCQWIPGDPSPNRMDALVWAITSLMTASGFQVMFEA
jgi:phage terminase large subunit-like protein